jgi:galactofuranose transport system ATP-binding protein
LDSLVTVMTEPILVARGLSKSFPGVKALDQVNFDVLPGEIHALMGENGAGKSTLIKVLTGVHPKDSGEISLGGALIEPKSPRDAEQLGLSTVYQEISLIHHLSVAENILLGRQPRRFGLIDHRAMRRRAQDVLTRLELKELDATQSVNTFSAAVQQMVQIARALAIDAKLLILDEPTSSLDEIEVARLFRVIRRLRDDGLGIVFVTHFLDQVYEVCSRITVLRNGKRVACRAVEELPRIELIEAMLGRSVTTTRDANPEEQKPTSGKPPVLAARRLERRGVIGPIEFELRAGDVLGLAGLLGSGRSEVARMVFGIDPADSGQIEIDQKPIAVTSPKQAIRAGLAFLAEERKLEGVIPNLSVRENIILALQASRGVSRLLSSAEQHQLANHYIQALNIKTPTPETPIRLLSGGNQQKVLLGRWLAMQPKVLILDEPTRGIDVGAKAEIEKLISELSAKGVATLLISSELEEVSRNCTRVLVLRDRKQVTELDGPSLEPSDIMRAIAGHAPTPPSQVADETA